MALRESLNLCKQHNKVNMKVLDSKDMSIWPTVNRSGEV